MKYVEDIEKIVLLTIIANKITLDKPINLMLVAKSESGGSEILKEFEQIPNVYSTSDLTYSGLVINLLDDIDAGKIDVIIISDYNKVVDKSVATARSIESALCDLMEEGIHNICQIGKMKKDYSGKYVKCGLIAKMTSDKYAEVYLTWLASGFHQRFLFVRWEYESFQKEQITTYLKDDLKIEKVKFILPKINGIKINFNIPLGLLDNLNSTIEKLYEKHYSYGFRVTIALKELCKANCFLRYIIKSKFNSNSKGFKLPKTIDLIVEQQDVNDIIRLGEYMILKDKKIPIDNSPDIKPFKQITKLTDIQKMRVKEALEKQEIKDSSKESIEEKDALIEHSDKESLIEYAKNHPNNVEKDKIIESYSEELQKYIKEHQFEKLDNQTLSNNIFNDTVLEVKLKRQFLKELGHSKYLIYLGGE